MVWYFLTLKENWDECCLNTGKHTSKYIRPKDTPGSEVDSTIFSHKKSCHIQFNITFLDNKVFKTWKQKTCIQNGISFPSHYDLAVQVNSTQNVLGRSENFNLMTTQAWQSNVITRYYVLGWVEMERLDDL